MSGQKAGKILGKLVVIVIAVIIFGNFATSSTAGVIGVIVSIAGGLIWLFKTDKSKSNKSSNSNNSYERVTIYNPTKNIVEISTNGRKSGIDLFTLKPGQKQTRDCQIGSYIEFRYSGEINWYRGQQIRQGTKVIHL